MRGKNLTPNESRKKKYHSASITDLPNDLLLALFSSLDLNTILEMKHVSKRLYRNINRLLSDIIFWNRFPQLNVTKDEIKKHISKGKRSLHWLPGLSVTSLEDNLQSVSKIYPYYKKNDTLSFFYRNQGWEKKRVWQNFVASYALEDLQPVILKDRASTFLRKASRLGDLYPFIQGNSLDLASISKVLSFFDQNTPGGRFIVGDLTFIGLIPHLIQSKASRCFDVVIRTYLSIHSLYSTIEQNDDFSISRVIQLISMSGVKDYLICFFDLMVMLYPVDDTHPYLYWLIEYFYDNNMSDVVYESINSLTDERKEEIMEQWRKFPGYADLLQQLYVEEECREILLAACKKSVGFFTTTARLSVEDLMRQQKRINSVFSATIEMLQNDGLNYRNEKGTVEHSNLS